VDSDTRADRLAEIAAQFAVRIRDDDPDDVAAWLVAQLPDPADLWRLLFVQAAANPATRLGFSRAVRWASPPTDPTHIDEIAVERACHGEPVTLTRAERAVAWAKLERRGLSAKAIGETLRMSKRSVVRRRRSA
jgi:hypothetical protein